MRILNPMPTGLPFMELRDLARSSDLLAAYEGLKASASGQNYGFRGPDPA
jgi:hypothetical protein